MDNILEEDSLAWQKLSSKRQAVGQQGMEQYATAREQYSDNEVDDNFQAFAEDSDEFENDNAQMMPANVGNNYNNLLDPMYTILGNFEAYCNHARKNFMPFTELEKAAIKLLLVLRHTKASLDTYEEVMEWHLVSCKKLREHESLRRSFDFLSKEKLFNKLRIRYNMDKNYRNVTNITLPSSKARVNIVWNDAQMVVQSLLTDPRITDEDYLFFNNDPFEPPPDDLDYVEDINTGTAYRETYRHYIKDPKTQVLLPILFYIDAATTGQFSALPITAVKITLGIFNRKAREKPYLWRTLGYIPAVTAHKSRGKRLLKESRHVDAQMPGRRVAKDEGIISKKVKPAQDLHAMLAVVFKSFLALQKSGLMWHLYYRKKVFRFVHFVIFVPFIKADTDEAEKFCGKYTSRSGNVKMLCRYCECPTQRCDDPLANYPVKRMAKIQALIDNKDWQGLKDLSQQYITNAFYPFRFGCHNDQGVHGSCPMEMLHQILLGIFRYVRDCLFEQIGKSSEEADKINALSQEYGELFGHQSERDMPKTKFKNGIRRGKIMGKEYTGILLCMAAVLRSKAGRDILSKKKAFANEKFVADWIMLVETLLQWEAWLKSDRMKKNHVEASERKHRYIMYLIKKVGARTKGMGLKIVKFHALMHITADILANGVPMVADTGADESGHKPTKTAAKLTQKREETFDFQTDTRLDEVHQLYMSEEEMAGRALWNYLDGYKHECGELPEKNEEYTVGGTKLVCYFDRQSRKNVVELRSRVKDEEAFRVEQGLVDFVVALQNKVSEHYNEVPLRTSHKRNGVIFRGSACFKGKVWRDWVKVDWDDDGKLPNKIWGFVNLLKLPQNSGIDFGGLVNLQPGLYAIVENAEYSKEQAEIDMSEIFVPIRKEVGRMQHGLVKELKFYLADVEAFIEPLTVIPDVGGKPNAYFIVRNKTHWRQQFEEWLECDPNDDEFSDEEVLNCDEDADDNYVSEAEISDDEEDN